MALVTCGPCAVVAEDSLRQAPTGTGEETLESRQLRKFLDARCVGCHNAKKHEGEVALDQWPDVPLWQRVFLAVEGGDMPPAGAKQPPAVERAVAVRWMRQVL